jgi:hypothetical protein
MNPRPTFGHATAAVLAVVVVSAIGTADQPTRQAIGSPSAASIAGVVVDADSRQPIPNAMLSLTGTSGPPPRLKTGDDGRFEFVGLKPGQYPLFVTALSYVSIEYGARRTGEPGTPITVTDGGKVHLTVPLVRAAAISGTLTNEAGEPVAGVAVAVWRWGYTRHTGDRTLVGVSYGVATDDRGRYRIFGLLPGQYVVATTGEEPPRSGPQSSQPPDDVIRVITHADVEVVRQSLVAPPPKTLLRANPTLTFFPGVVGPSDATPVSIVSGQERTSVDFTVRTAPLARISGTVSVANAIGSNDISVLLTAKGLRRLTSSFGVVMVAGADRGQFALVGVQPGDYVLRATGTVNKVPAYAWQELTVNGRDISGVTLTLQPGVPVSGRVQFTGQPPFEVGSQIRLEIREVDDIPYGRRGPAATPARDGRFSFAALAPGRYLIEGGVGGQTGWWMRSAIVDRVDAVDVPIDVADTALTDVVVTITNAVNEISGVVHTSSGAVLTSGWIVVVPTDRSLWRPGSRRIVGVRSATDGQYVVRRLPAGEYFIAAVSEIEPGQWFNREYLEELTMTSPPRVVLSDGERKRQDLHLNRTP